MESTSSLFLFSPFALLLTTLLVLGALKLFATLYQQYTYWKKRDVPHPSLFFKIGWKVILRRIDFIEYMCYIYNCHPDAKFIGLMDFSTPIVFLRDSEIIRDIMVKDFEHFPDHRNFIDENIDKLLGKNIFSLRGARWKEMRNTLSPSFTASKMKIMFELVSKCSRDFVDYLVDHPEYCSTMETKEAFRRYTNDVIATAAFGISVNSMKDRDNEFYRRGVEITKFSGLLPLLKILLLRLSPRFYKLIGLNFIPSATSHFFKRVVKETIKVREEQDIIRPDMIHLLMQARNRDGPSASEMTLDDIVAQAFIFFLAGFDTSARLMCFVVHELAVNRDVQDRLREEVEEYFVKDNDEITYESLSKMVYMDMVISETLRKFPPAILNDRVCAKSYELSPSQPGRKSVVIDAGTIMWVSIYSLHHDPKYYPNPSKFDPERFSNENKHNIVPYTYLPFGLGPRKCIGNRFALMETKLLVAHLLKKFILKTTEKTVEPVVFDKKQVVLQPVGGFWIGLEKRETS